MHVIMALVHLWPWMLFIIAGVAIFAGHGLYQTAKERHLYK